jgi:hypothetical protein
MRAKFINEKFQTETDPIHDMNIGELIKIQKAMQGIIDLYGTGGELQKIDNDEEYGYMCEFKFADDMDYTYYITYNYEMGWQAGYEDMNEPNNTAEDFSTLEECVDKVENWVEWAQEQNEDN